MPLRMRVHAREPIGLALRRFKKLLERSGIQKELHKRKYYEKPCEARRRAELRKQSAIRKARNAGTRKPEAGPPGRQASGMGVSPAGGRGRPVRHGSLAGRG